MKKHFLGWHGVLGNIIYVLALVTVNTGVQLLFEETDVGQYYGYYDQYGQYVFPPSDIQNLKKYAIAIYVLSLVLGTTILFYQYVVRCWDIIPHPMQVKVISERDADEDSK